MRLFDFSRKGGQICFQETTCLVERKFSARRMRWCAGMVWKVCRSICCCGFAGECCFENLFDRDDHLLYLTWYVFGTREAGQCDSRLSLRTFQRYGGSDVPRPDAGAAAPGGDVRSGGTAGGADALYRQYSKVRPGVRALCVTQENRGKISCARISRSRAWNNFLGKPSDGRQGVRNFWRVLCREALIGADPGYLSAGADKVLCDAAGAFGGTAAPVPVGGGCAFRCGYDFCLF